MLYNFLAADNADTADIDIYLCCSFFVSLTLEITALVSLPPQWKNFNESNWNQSFGTSQYPYVTSCPSGLLALHKYLLYDRPPSNDYNKICF